MKETSKSEQSKARPAMADAESELEEPLVDGNAQSEGGGGGGGEEWGVGIGRNESFLVGGMRMG